MYLSRTCFNIIAEAYKYVNSAYKYVESDHLVVETIDSTCGTLMLC